MPEPDDHDLTGLPNLTTAGDGPRATHAPLPLKGLAEQAEAMTDIGVPGHLLDADPPDELLDLDTVRSLIYNETVPLARRDAAWRYLITNAVPPCQDVVRHPGDRGWLVGRDWRCVREQQQADARYRRIRAGQPGPASGPA